MSVTQSASYKKAIAEWKRNCSYTHSLICPCKDYTSHFKWLGYREANGYASDSATGKVVPGPLDGATITGTGSTSDVEEAIDAAVSFQLDDSGPWERWNSTRRFATYVGNTSARMSSTNQKTGECWIRVVVNELQSVMELDANKNHPTPSPCPWIKTKSARISTRFLTPRARRLYESCVTSSLRKSSERV
nr:ORF3 [Torque teno neovison virus]